MTGPKEHTFHCHSGLVLESGKKLSAFDLKYHTWGTINEQGDNVIWICHALTAGSDVSLWWPGLVGPGKLYDPEKHFIICANSLGGCYGSTGPLSPKPQNNQPYYHSFPDITNRDIIACFDRLRCHHGINQVHTIIGGSLGGQHSLEWVISKPEVFKRLIVLASNGRHSPWGIAFNDSQRHAIEQDITWQLNTAKAGENGMKVARSIALLSYRNYSAYAITQTDDHEVIDRFRAASYQRYQGEKLVARNFNAFTYWHLSRAMDSHNVGRSRGGVEAALKQIKADSLIIGIDSDILFPPAEQEFLARHIPGSKLHIIHSDYGHDGFLLEEKQLTELIINFYKESHTSVSVAS